MVILAEQMELSEEQQIQWNEDGNGKNTDNLMFFFLFKISITAWLYDKEYRSIKLILRIYNGNQEHSIYSSLIFCQNLWHRNKKNLLNLACVIQGQNWSIIFARAERRDLFNTFLCLQY